MSQAKSGTRRGRLGRLSVEPIYPGKSFVQMHCATRWPSSEVAVFVARQPLPSGTAITGHMGSAVAYKLPLKLVRPPVDGRHQGFSTSVDPRPPARRQGPDRRRLVRLAVVHQDHWRSLDAASPTSRSTPPHKGQQEDASAPPRRLLPTGMRVQAGKAMPLRGRYRSTGGLLAGIAFAAVAGQPKFGQEREAAPFGPANAARLGPGWRNGRGCQCIEDARKASMRAIVLGEQHITRADHTPGVAILIQHV